MKYYPLLLALCQDIEINLLEDVETIFRNKEERIVLGPKINIKDTIFGEDATEIEKISSVVSNMFLRARNYVGPSGGEKGHLENVKNEIITQIAETYQDVIIYLFNNQVCPDSRLIVDQGFFYKTIGQEEFEAKLKKANQKIRDKAKFYHEACAAYRKIANQ